MSQITVYLDKETEEKLQSLTESLDISPSEWPESVISLAGIWADFPTAEAIRANLGADAAQKAI
ncbi:MAG TPA: CopG family transcriptional regulator [Anaerolineae bacterium]|nr:CopG family transcriptional regulator [Anaerolineae bacterium]HIP71558.1 CopG family transcriptional regulator [Anaerolineae bacterium]